MRRALFFGLVFGFISACAVSRFIAAATYPDYYEVAFTDGSKTSKSWFCTRELGDAGIENRLECIDGMKFIDTLLGQATGRTLEVERRWTAEGVTTVEVSSDAGF